MAQQQCGQRRAEGNRGFDVGLAAYGQDHAAHQPHHPRDLGNGDRDHHREKTASGNGDERNGQEDGRNGHDAVHHPHDDAISHADVAGDHADKKAERYARQRSPQTNEE